MHSCEFRNICLSCHLWAVSTCLKPPFSDAWFAGPASEQCDRNTQLRLLRLGCGLWYTGYLWSLNTMQWLNSAVLSYCLLKKGVKVKEEKWEGNLKLTIFDSIPILNTLVFIQLSHTHPVWSPGCFPLLAEFPLTWDGGEGKEWKKGSTVKLSHGHRKHLCPSTALSLWLHPAPTQHASGNKTPFSHMRTSLWVQEGTGMC